MTSRRQRFTVDLDPIHIFCSTFHHLHSQPPSLSISQPLHQQEAHTKHNMAEMISGLAGGLQGSLTGMLNKGSAWLDNIFPPEKRNELMAKISKFATEKPMMAVRLRQMHNSDHDN